MEATGRECKVPAKIVEAVLKSSFKMVTEVMKDGDRENAIFKTVDMPGLGVFNTKPSWTAKVQARGKLKEQKKNGTTV